MTLVHRTKKTKTSDTAPHTQTNMVGTTGASLTAVTMIISASTLRFALSDFFVLVGKCDNLIHKERIIFGCMAGTPLEF